MKQSKDGEVVLFLMKQSKGEDVILNEAIKNWRGYS